MGVRGTAASWPRRRRGGSRGARSGGVARGGEVQREGEWVQEVFGVPRGAVGKQELACGPPRRRAALNCAGGGEAKRERGGRRVDCFAISENSRDPTINQQ